FAGGIEAKYFCRRAARRIERAFGVEPDGPKIRSIRVSEQAEFRSEFEAAIAAHRHTMRGAFEEFIISGLAPAASMLGEGGGEAQEAKEVQEVKDSEKPSARSWLGHGSDHRTCRFREIPPETGPPRVMEASLANDSRSTCTLPRVGRLSTLALV